MSIQLPLGYLRDGVPSSSPDGILSLWKRRKGTDTPTLELISASWEKMGPPHRAVASAPGELAHPNCSATCWLALPQPMRAWCACLPRSTSQTASLCNYCPDMGWPSCYQMGCSLRAGTMLNSPQSPNLHARTWHGAEIDQGAFTG